jgi:hypothetical protein
MLTKYPPGPAICFESKENTELAAVLRRDHDPHSNE